MRDESDTLVMGRVVGDVLDPFIRSITLSVRYRPHQYLVNGARLRPSEISTRPRVNAGGELRTLFTLVLVDPDSPSPSDPTKREYLHWLVSDIPGSTDASFGKEIIGYEAPNPTVGIHRLVFVLFRQASRQPARPPAERGNFNTRAFAEEHCLGAPVGAVYFNCHREKGAVGRKFV
nr:FTL2 protein [Lemna aequinoctialis]